MPTLRGSVAKAGLCVTWMAAVIASILLAVPFRAAGADQTAASATAPRWEDLKRTILLQGKVLDPADRPAAAARLYLSVNEYNDPIELGTSDADGSYRFEVAEQTLRRSQFGNMRDAKCHASLIATADGFGPGWAELLAVDGGRFGEMKFEYASEIHLATDFPTAGRIVLTNGKPVVGATVSVVSIVDLSDPRWHKMHTAIKSHDTKLMARYETDPNVWFTPIYRSAWRVIPSVTTDSDGQFRLTDIGGDRAVNLRVTGRGIRSTNVSVLTRDDVTDFTRAIRELYPRTPRPHGYFYPRRKDIRDGDQGVRLFGPLSAIEVDPARTITGVARDASTGQPIAGVRVAVANTYSYTTTDKDGRYTILRGDDASSITVYAMVRYSARYLSHVRQIDNVEELAGIEADFDLLPGVIVTGRVVESGTDQPIVSAPRTGCHYLEPGPLRAGNVFYFPLATNTALRGTPEGLYFEGFRGGDGNYSISAAIDGDGRFRLAVPPGPGVLMVKAAAPLPFMFMGGVYKESTGLHRRCPYVTLTARARDDGGPAGDAQNLPGFKDPIPIGAYHAYRVINPSAATKRLDLNIDISRATSRVLRFVDPTGQAVQGVSVSGMQPRINSRLMIPTTIVFDGPEVDVHGLQPGKSREVIALSNDGKHTANILVGVDDPPTRTIELQPAASVSGRLVDATTGLPLAGYTSRVDSSNGYRQLPEAVKTDADGRFLIRSLLPGQAVSISFREPRQPGPANGQNRKPEALHDLVLQSAELRDVGDIRIPPPAKK